MHNFHVYMKSYAEMQLIFFKYNKYFGEKVCFSVNIDDYSSIRCTVTASFRKVDADSMNFSSASVV